MAPKRSEVTIISTETELRSLLDIIDHLDIKKLSLYRWKPAPLSIDLQTVKVNGIDSISILPLFIFEYGIIELTVLIDVLTLGVATFATKNANGTSLKNILESPTTPKMSFDIRNGASTLLTQYGIHLNCFKDLRRMELNQTEKDRKPTHPSRPSPIALGDCLQNVTEINVSKRRAFDAAEVKARKLFDPAHGGSNAVFNERPLREELVQYCADTVRFLVDVEEKYRDWEKYEVGADQDQR